MSFWEGRRVFLTGHTGFKGSWLSLWLEQLGAEICGVSLDPPSEPNLFCEAKVAQGLRSEIFNVLDLPRLKSLVKEFRPEIVFHLAAQPLVRDSYADPVGTYTTNVIGTANVLDSIREAGSVRAVVVITTDKCYENQEWVWAYRETDRLGGHDPYSASKACAELVVSSYRNSFFPPDEYQRHGISVASARAGNVIGGGDWARDRIVPDIMRAFVAKEILMVRNPNAVRPWQHVLEPLSGYLKLAQALVESGPKYGDAWNFGPHESDEKSVEWIVQQLAYEWGVDAQWQMDDRPRPHEAQILKLDWSKAAKLLGWHPVLPLQKALHFTAEWYRRRDRGEDVRTVTMDQIMSFVELSQTGLRH